MKSCESFEGTEVPISGIGKVGAALLFLSLSSACAAAKEPLPSAHDHVEASISLRAGEMYGKHLAGHHRAGAGYIGGGVTLSKKIADLDQGSEVRLKAETDSWKQADTMGPIHHKIEGHPLNFEEDQIVVGPEVRHHLADGEIESHLAGGFRWQHWIRSRVMGVLSGGAGIRKDFGAWGFEVHGKGAVGSSFGDALQVEGGLEGQVFAKPNRVITELGFGTLLEGWNQQAAKLHEKTWGAGPSLRFEIMKVLKLGVECVIPLQYERKDSRHPHAYAVMHKIGDDIELRATMQVDLVQAVENLSHLQE